MKVLGIDPGKSGAAAVIDVQTGEVVVCKLDETERDIWNFIKENRPDCAVLERVSAMPRQGVSSTFKFGTSFGFCKGLMVAAGVPFVLITPAEWQKSLRCLSKGDKNITKQKAQELFPSIKMTHKIADAILIAEYLRRHHNDLFATVSVSAVAGPEVTVDIAEASE